MHISAKLLIGVVAIVSIVLIIGAYVALNNFLAPLEQKQEQATFPGAQYVEIQADTLNGNIIKPLLNDKTVTATTNNGRIDLKDDNATSITASSLNGNVDLRLVEGTLFKVDATTANGHVSYQGIAMNINSQTATNLNANTTQGPGNLDIKLSTANGNISIEYFNK